MRKCVLLLTYLAILGHAIDIKRNVKDSEVSEGPSDANLGPTLKNVNKFNRPSSLSAKRESEEEEDQQPLKLPKINNQGTQCYDVPSSKRSVDLETDLELAKPKPYEKYKRRRSPYGIVYNQGRPIGILEPISKIYEFEDYKPQNEMEDAAKAAIDKRGLEAGGDESLVGEGGRYSNVLTNFKIGNRMKMKQLGDEAPFERKRERVYNKRSAQIPRKAKKLNEIEDNLKEIMNDLGLVDEAKKEDKQKRETGLEDEDLETGPNKIGLIKESHSNERNKKEDCPGKTFGTDFGDKTSPAKPIRKGPDTSVLNSDEAQFEPDKKKKAKITDYRSEGEAFIRSKRQQNDIIKGLETSGDLTLSGNKSPLASSSTGNDNETLKQKAIARDNEEKKDKQISTENQEYEKRLQRNIQNKISEIKEEVKREIKVLKSKEGAKAKGEEKKKKREGGNKGTRRKRFLLEKESKDIDPLSLETDLEVHIRRRRHIDQEKAEGEEEEKDEAKRVTWTELSGVDKREGREKAMHDPKSYKFEPRTKKSPDSEDKDELVKRSDDGGKVVEGSSGFRDVQNRAAAGQAGTQAEHALAARDSAAKSARAGSRTEADLNDERLERLVSESATLTESVKNERGARSGDSPRIEVELHSKDDLKPKEVTKLHEEKKSMQKEEEEAKRNEEEVEIDKRSPLGQELVYKEDKAKIAREASEEKKKEVAKPNKETSEVVEDKNKEVEEKKEDAKISEEEALKTSDVKESVLKRSIDQKENSKREGRSNKDEEKLEPDLTLEDMQKLDSENTVKRRKRTSRTKRDYSEPNNMQFRTYRGEEEDADDEADEFDDDNFDDRTANLIRKRDIYEDVDEDEYTPVAQKEVSKRNARLKNFVADLNSDVYENPNYLYNTRKKRDNPDLQGAGQNSLEQVSESSNNRKKRESLGDLSGPTMQHFAAAKERNLQSLDSSYRRKRLEKMNLKQSKDQTITGLSESDIFGGFPQSYEGELSRFKRVKRENNLDKGSS